ncbi:sugar phosphate isomerase/epimerase family protein [Athalassotoga sp.]|uniref:sugar phosphate isomerase/epimerase family protein n=1 Tax=Athalassotoga sp. TaxID=2022597 RepID=UPI003D011DD3
MMIPMALQLYTLRDVAEKDFSGTLKRVSQIGYTGVEFAGYGGMEAKDLKNLLDELNLKPAGSHVGVDVLTTDLKKVIDYNSQIGNHFIVCPWQKYATKDDFLSFAKVLNEIGQKCHDNGLKLCYHNHAHEFERFQGNYGLDLLFENTDPDLVDFEIDTYWVEYAGADPISYIRKFGKRASLLHLKDMERVGKDFAEVGTGIMDIRGIVSTAKFVGTKWLIVEQDKCKKDPFESIKISLDNLKKIDI